MKQPDLFNSPSRSLTESLRETADLLNEYGPRYDHWSIAYSGGKDSSAATTAVIHLIAEGVVAPPKTLTVLRADTRMELPPLDATAEELMAALRLDGYEARTVLPPLNDRFFVYMLGRGVPPPSNTFRWCTDKLKISPMAHYVRALARIADSNGKTLMLTGVRIGESARRDDSIAAACSRDGAECGQGRLHLNLAGSKDNDINRFFVPGTDKSPCDTLAPILHWRVCHVWDWLNSEGEAPDHKYASLTAQVADAYGFGALQHGEAARKYEEAARTGCVGCNLASRDVALERLIARAEYAYLAPLMRLRPLYAELKKPHNRLRKPGGERRKDGKLCANQNRMGPLTFEARRWGLGEVLDIQHEVMRAGYDDDRPIYRLINSEEEHRIGDLIDSQRWPDGWSGNEPRADQPFAEWRADGTVQLSLLDDAEDDFE